MRKKNIIIVSVSIMVLWVGLIGIGEESRSSEKKNERIRVGIYDSRAVAVAYAHSDYFRKKLDEKKQELEKAKSDGDTEKVKALEAWGSEGQHKMHLQGFGSAPVRDLLEPVKDSLPEIARSCGVDIIVSQWLIDYQAPNAELVDITNEMIKPFKPNERVLNIVESMKDKSPISEAEIMKHDH